MVAVLDVTEGLKAGYAVVRREGHTYKTVKAERLKGQQSAQRAEVRAVIEALKQEEEKKDNHLH